MKNSLRNKLEGFHSDTLCTKPISRLPLLDLDLNRDMPTSSQSSFATGFIDVTPEPSLKKANLKYSTTGSRPSCETDLLYRSKGNQSRTFSLAL
jgi:hypothetical protein